MASSTDQAPRLAPVPRGVRPPTGRAVTRDIDGIRVHSQVWGGPRTAEHPPVVLVHGLVVASDMTVPTARRLATRQRVLAPDLPGFGRSDRPDHTPGVGELADALTRWMGQIAPGGAVVVGNSFGCQVAIHAAALAPDSVRALVLAGPTVDRHARSWPAQLLRWQREQVTQSWAMRRIQVRDYARAGLRRAVKTFAAALRDQPEKTIRACPQPVLVVRGTRDPIASRRWVEELAAAAPRGDLAVLPGVRHAMAPEDPLPFSRTVNAFLDRILTTESTT
jgi:pimeloyl-ACP methyl ester carboxylesterase